MTGHQPARRRGRDRVVDLSVVIVAGDRAAPPTETIASLAAQDHPGPIETVVVWTGPGPAPAVTVDDPHRPVRVVDDQQRGRSAALNRGAAAADGAVLGFGDVHDRWLPSRARRQLDLLADLGASVVSSGVTVVDGHRVRDLPGVDGVVRYVDLLHGHDPEASPSTALVRTDAFRGGIGPFDELVGGGVEGEEWMLRAARRGPIPVASEPLVRRDRTAGVDVDRRWADREAGLRRLLALNPDVARDPTARARLEARIALAVAAQRRRREALRQVREALRWSWWEPRSIAALAVAAGVPADRVASALHRRGRSW